MGLVVTTILAFILDYFQNFINKFLINFSKNSKKKIFWRKCGPFLLKFGQKLFPWKNGFKYPNYLPSSQKSEKVNESEKNV